MDAPCFMNWLHSGPLFQPQADWSPLRLHRSFALALSFLPNLIREITYSCHFSQTAQQQISLLHSLMHTTNACWAPMMEPARAGSRIRSTRTTEGLRMWCSTIMMTTAIQAGGCDPRGFFVCFALFDQILGKCTDFLILTWKEVPSSTDLFLLLQVLTDDLRPCNT